MGKLKRIVAVCLILCAITSCFPGCMNAELEEIHRASRELIVVNGMNEAAKIEAFVVLDKTSEEMQDLLQKSVEIKNTLENVQKNKLTRQANYLEAFVYHWDVAERPQSEPVTFFVVFSHCNPSYYDGYSFSNVSVNNLLSVVLRATPERIYADLLYQDNSQISLVGGLVFIT